MGFGSAKARGKRMNSGSLMKMSFHLWIGILLCSGLAYGVGLGVSPPIVELEKGIGRMVLFNPSDQPIVVTIDVEGDLNARPRSARIGGLKAQEIMVWGTGNGLARIFAENRETGGALPSIQVEIHGDQPTFSRLTFQIIGGILAVLFIVVWEFVKRKRFKRVCYS